MKSLIFAGVLAALASTAAAQPAPASPDTRFDTTTLELSASGETRVRPDMATIGLGVTQQAPTAVVAMQSNAAAMTRVIEALKAGGVDARDIQTSNLSLNPQYVYEQDKPPRLTGYEASNQVTVTVHDLTRLGRAVDAVVGAGATNIGSISFGLNARLPAENLARLAAVKALEDKAALYADATGYHIRRLVTLSESGGYSGPPMVPVMAMARMAAPTPVEAGDLTVRVDVSAEFELSR